MEPNRSVAGAYLEATTTGMHFAHIKPVDATAHKGQKLAYSMRVYLLP